MELEKSSPCGFNKGHDSKFSVGSRVKHETPEEGHRTCWLKEGCTSRNLVNIIKKITTTVRVLYVTNEKNELENEVNIR